MVATSRMASTRFSMSVLMASTLLLASVPFVAAQEPVSWANQVNVAARGGGLEKIRGCDGCEDAGAASRQSIRSGDGFVEFTVGEDHTYWMAGLSRRPGGTQFESIDFGIRLNGNGWADVVEGGTYIGGDTGYEAGDVFRIEIAGGRVQYVRNGQVIHVSQKRPTYPLVFDVSLGSMGASVTNARIATRGSDLAAAGPQSGAEDIDFRALDRNDDGAISPSEWRGPRRTFNERDVDRDGLITRRDLGIDERRPSRFEPDQPRTRGTAGELVIVSGTERWTDTGVTVNAGDTISFEAEGTVQMSGDRNDTASPAGSRRRAPDALLRESAAGSLIARIGNSAPFLVGDRRTIARAPAGGRLFLGVNDDYLGDNSGEFRVLVTVGSRLR
jgi:hypothetical protein